MKKLAIREYSMTRDSTRQLSPGFYVEGVPVATVAAYAETLLPGRGGIGRYPKDAKHPARKTGWVHIDTRTNKSRWKG